MLPCACRRRLRQKISKYVFRLRFFCFSPSFLIVFKQNVIDAKNIHFPYVDNSYIDRKKIIITGPEDVLRN